MGAYDQFAENRTKFGVSSEFDITMYTSHVNSDEVPLYELLASLTCSEIRLEAEQMEQEIKKMDGTSNLHLLEERGFEVDAENGVSGTAAFKAEGVLGMTKSLTQTVYPASRRSYTFSAQIASEDLQKGPSGQVGIEVTFEYEDGSTETRFIDLF